MKLIEQEIGGVVTTPNKKSPDRFRAVEFPRELNIIMERKGVDLIPRLYHFSG